MKYTSFKYCIKMVIFILLAIAVPVWLIGMDTFLKYVNSGNSDILSLIIIYAVLLVLVILLALNRYEMYFDGKEIEFKQVVGENKIIDIREVDKIIVKKNRSSKYTLYYLCFKFKNDEIEKEISCFDHAKIVKALVKACEKYDIMFDTTEYYR